mgnify:CR=1 FL=1
MPIIVLDPGHGGHSTAGKSSPHGLRTDTGVLEKDLVLQLARQVAARLGGAVLTRPGDVNVSLADRAALARRHGARVFVSLHLADAGPSGVYVHAAASPASYALAGALQGSLGRLGGAGGVQAAELAVLSPTHHDAGTAACLVEVDGRASADLGRLGGAIAGAIERHLGRPQARGLDDDGGVITLPEVVITPPDKIRSSAITVAGKPFADWFNNDFRPLHPGNHDTLKLWKKPAPKFPAKVNGANFATVFDDCAGLWSAELTLEEFLTFFAIIYNETGGTFLPISELGSEAYMFERSAAGKASYNAAPNRPAGGLLFDRGVLTDPDDVDAWNSTTTYPKPTDPALIAAARECDFWKYRGRGLIQLTWRPTYLAIVDPLLTAAGHAKCDDLSEAELGRIIRTDPKVYIPMVRGFFKKIAGKLAQVNQEPPDWNPVGKAVSGGADYGKLLHWRCETLAEAIYTAGYTAT